MEINVDDATEAFLKEQAALLGISEVDVVTAALHRQAETHKLRKKLIEESRQRRPDSALSARDEEDALQQHLEMTANEWLSEWLARAAHLDLEVLTYAHRALAEEIASRGETERYRDVSSTAVFGAEWVGGDYTFQLSNPRGTTDLFFRYRKETTEWHFRPVSSPRYLNTPPKNYKEFLTTVRRFVMAAAVREFQNWPSYR